MKKHSISIVLIFLAFTAIGCGILGNLRRSGSTLETNKSANTANVANSQPQKPDYKALKDKAKELATLSPPVKLDPKAKIKGKVTLVEKTDYDTFSVKGFNYIGDDFEQSELDDYGLRKERLAGKSEEIDTLIQVICDKGKQIGKYNVTDGRTLPAYAVNCKVSVVDYKTPSIVAQRNFTGRDLADNITVYKSTTDVTALAPTDEIKKYIKNFKSE
jgi:hypothetical protein